MIAEMLHADPAETMTARDLAGLLGITPREVTRQIEKERAEGAPICARSGHNPGYFLAPDKESMTDYCKRLEHRRNAIQRTKQNCQRAGKKLKSRKDAALHL